MRSNHLRAAISAFCVFVLLLSVAPDFADPPASQPATGPATGPVTPRERAQAERVIKQLGLRRDALNRLIESLAQANLKDPFLKTCREELTVNNQRLDRLVQYLHTGEGGDVAAQILTDPLGPVEENAKKGPETVVFGDLSASHKIVFVCDATGTMINKLSLLKEQLSKAIEQLDPCCQSFNVIFYTDGGKVLIANRNSLMQSTADNKRIVGKWLEDVTSSGTTDPIPALQEAFRLNPNHVVFLSDGEFNNLRSYEEVSRAFKVGNRSKAVVDTVLFQTYDKEADKVLRQIASDHGGTYRYVKEGDLQ